MSDHSSVASRPNASPTTLPHYCQPASETPSMPHFQTSFVANNASNACGDADSEEPTGGMQQADIDPQILEALRSKDRLYVLKLGESIESLINDKSKVRLELNPATSYQRLLVHRCCAYYKMSPESDPVTKFIYVSLSTESRIPLKRISDLVPPEAHSQPSFKIMRRTPSDRRSKVASQASSVTGDDGDLSDDDASATGSAGGRSSATGASNKKWKTLEEREAAYQEARTRIWTMDFDENRKDAEKGTSASSSSQSLASGSNSANDGGSVYGDVDDSASSLAADSEWSAHAFSRDPKDGRRSGNTSKPSHGRGLRPSGLNSSGSPSSRNSRAPSPSFTYASLYEPAPMAWEHSQGGPVPPQGYPPGQYMYPYPPTQTPGGPFMHPYPYYPPYPPYPPPPHQNMHDPNTSPEMYPQQHPPPMGYGYVWQPHPPPPPPPPHMGVPPSIHMSQPQPPPPPKPTEDSNTSPPNQSPPFPPPFMHAPAYTYPMPGYYTPQPGHQPHIGSTQPMFDSPSSAGPGPMNGGGGNMPHPPATSHVNSDSGFRPGPNPHARRMSNTIPMDKPRSAPPQPRGPAWSYGPGMSYNGGPINNSNNHSTGNGEAVGPRFGPIRRQSSNHSNGSRRSASINDDVSSVASSSTSSSSRRTYTSTSSSHHPLPARPDWAVGLKADATLHATRQGMSRNVSGSSSSSSSHRQHRPNHGHQQHASDPTDFPPLSASEKRSAPVVAGAWTNPAGRTLLMNPAPGGASAHAGPAGNAANALVHHSNAPPSGVNSNANGSNTPANNNGMTNGVGGAPAPRSPEVEQVGPGPGQDRTFERHLMKMGAEPYNPRSPPGNRPFLQQRGGAPLSMRSPPWKERKDPVGLAEQVQGLSLEEQSSNGAVKEHSSGVSV